MGADGPDPKMEEELNLFGQFVGDWEIIEDRYLQSNGRWITQQGELHWRWILEGRALQDVWLSIDEKTQKCIPNGTTIGFYDPKIDAWHCTWISPTQGAVKIFIGRKIGDEIVLEMVSTGHSERVKWIFSEMTGDSFRWRSERSEDEGKTWNLREEMRIVRARDRQPQ